MKLADHFINTVVDELNHLNGSEFEALSRPFIEILTGREFELKGHSLEMKAVRGSDRTGERVPVSRIIGVSNNQ